MRLLLLLLPRWQVVGWEVAPLFLCVLLLLLLHHLLLHLLQHLGRGWAKGGHEPTRQGCHGGVRRDTWGQQCVCVCVCV